MPEDRREEFAEYPYISMQELKQRTERPRKVKMLLRDFIDGTSATLLNAYFFTLEEPEHTGFNRRDRIPFC